jgi:hypothetical protein
MATNHLLDADHFEHKTCQTTAHPNLVQVSFKHIVINLTSFMVKVKQSHYRPGQALRVPGG